MEEAEDKRRGECWIDIVGMIIHTLLKKPSPARFRDEYVPLFKVSKASWGSQVDQSSASWEKLTVSSWPSTGNTNSPLNVRDNRSVKFRKHWRRSSAFIPVVRVSASLQQVVTGSLVSWLRIRAGQNQTNPFRKRSFFPNTVFRSGGTFFYFFYLTLFYHPVQFARFEILEGGGRGGGEEK